MPLSRAEQLRRTRQFPIEIGKFEFTAVRPTVKEALEIQHEGTSPLEVARKFVVNWKNVTEADVLPQGTTDELSFDRELWSVWLDDRPDFWLPVYNGVLNAYSRYTEKREDLIKN